MERKIYWLQIAGQCGNDTDIRIRIPAGIAKEQADIFEVKLNEAIGKYGAQFDGDFLGLDYFDTLEEVAEDMQIEYEFAKVDYTIWI